MPALHLARFSFDVTPPIGHPLCGGWIEPAKVIDDPLKAIGVVLLGMGQPVVLCTVDWVGLRNEAFESWRRALADAAHTVPDHVALHCVHPHDAPFADVEAQKLVAEARGAPHNLDLGFFDRVVRGSVEALRASLGTTARFNQVGVGKARVDRVASSRRIVGPDGKVRATRTSATKSQAARDEPEGLIDPWLRTLGFWHDDKPLASLSYYACHPMSHYGRGRVSCDFCGLAREKRQGELPEVHQVYFNGAGGNITAGKYNDGDPSNRAVLRDRMHSAMSAAWDATERHRVDGWEWRVGPVTLPPRVEPEFGIEASRAVLDDPKQPPAKRGNAAYQIAWRRRADRPIDLTSLHIGPATLLHLPGEPFIEYQLLAHRLAAGATAFVAGYGDDGPGYLPTADAYGQGGYEPTVALSGPESGGFIQDAMARLLERS